MAIILESSVGRLHPRTIALGCKSSDANASSGSLAALVRNRVITTQFGHILSAQSARQCRCSAGVSQLSIHRLCQRLVVTPEALDSPPFPAIITEIGRTQLHLFPPKWPA